MLVDNKIMGVCLFDNPTDVNKEAWCSLAGEPAKRIQGISSLPQKTHWATNVRFNDYRRQSLGNLPNIKECQFMRLDPDKLVKELGTPDTENNMINAELIAEIYNRVANIGRDLMDITISNSFYKYLNNIESKVNLHTVKSQQQTDNQYIQEAIENSYQTNQARFGAKPTNSKPYHFTFPRIAYFKWIFSKKYPMFSDQFTPVKFRTGELTIGVKNGRKVEHHDERIKKFKEMLAKNDAAYFFKIEVSHTESFHTSFATFSCGAGEGAPISRNWVSLPELIEIARYSVVTVFNGYRAPLGNLPSEVLNLVTQKDSDQQAQIDDTFISKGIFLENVYSMLSGPMNKNKTALGVYMKAYDRMACLSVAEVFHRFGFAVGSYSTGKIILFLKDNEVLDACALAMMLGLMPPMPSIAGKVIDIDSEAQNIKMSKPDIRFSNNDDTFITPANMDKALQETLENNFMLKISKIVLGNGMLNTDFLMRFDRLYDEKDPVLQSEKFIELINNISEEADQIDENGLPPSDSDEQIIDL